jgi:metal-responsive CopG/Arc/MetJ family transcriptional regulator
MRLKDRREIIRDLFRKYIPQKENLIEAKKLFIINSVVNYVYGHEDQKEINKLLAFYGELISKYLKDEVDLYWKDGRIAVRDLSEN